MELAQYISEDFSIAMDYLVYRLCTPGPELINILKDFPNCKLTGDNISLKLIYPRKTIILREVVEGTTEEMVRSLFSKDIQMSIEKSFPNANCTFYLVFKTEESANAAMKELCAKATLNGHAIVARFKNENPTIPVVPQQIDYSYGYNFGHVQRGKPKYNINSRKKGKGSHDSKKPQIAVIY